MICENMRNKQQHFRGGQGGQNWELIWSRGLFMLQNCLLSCFWLTVTRSYGSHSWARNLFS